MKNIPLKDLPVLGLTGRSILYITSLLVLVCNPYPETLICFISLYTGIFLYKVFKY